jgi:hypothetical protein
VGLPRTYVRFVCLSLNTHFAETGPGERCSLLATGKYSAPARPHPFGSKASRQGGVISRSLYPDAEMSSVPVPRFRQAEQSPQGPRPRDLDR